MSLKKYRRLFCEKIILLRLSMKYFVMTAKVEVQKILTFEMKL